MTYVKRRLTIEQFRAVASQRPSDTAVRFVSRGPVRSSASKPRELDFVVSTDEIDRAGDTIAVDGWDVRSYMLNPVVLWSHHDRDPPIGRAKSVRREGSTLVATLEFISGEIYPFGASIYEMLKAGFLRATSVGFLPQQYAYNPVRDAVDYVRQELLEISITPIGCNSSALQTSNQTDVVAALFAHPPGEALAWPPSPVRNAFGGARGTRPPAKSESERSHVRRLREFLALQRASSLREMQDEPDARKAHAKRLAEFMKLRRQLSLSFEPKGRP